MRKLLLGILLGLLLSALPGRAEAAVQGIAIAPSLQEVALGRDQPSGSFKVELANTTDAVVDLTLSMLDFGALDESGGIAFIGRSGQETNTFGLRQWMSLEKDRLTLEPGVSQSVTVTIENKESLGPGGHYGAVIVAGANRPGESTDDVSVLPAASTLVFLNKSGGEIRQLNLDSQQPNGSWFRLPSSATLRFRNNGNTHVVPRGMVELFGPTGNRLGRSVINPDSSYVLPGSFRQFQQEFQQQGQPWLPGRYRIVTSWRYDGKEESEVAIRYVWYAGRLLVYMLILFVAALTAMVYIRSRRRSLI